MKVISEKELPSGEYELEFDFSEEEIDLLVTYAVEKILEEQLEKEKKN